MPPDYFQTAGVTAQRTAVSATPLPFASRSRLPFYVKVGAGLALLLTLVLVGLLRGQADARRRADAPTSPTASDLQMEPTTPSTSPPSQAPVERSVVVITEPVDAMVSLDGVDLGQQPVVKMQAGTTTTVRVTRTGYQTQTVTLESDEVKRKVKLTPAAGAKSRNPSSGPASSQPVPAVAPVGTGAPRPSDVLGDPWHRSTGKK